MVPCLARSAVIIKSKNETSIILSNYELAYALGILCKVGDFQIPEYDNMKELKERLMSQINTYETEEPFEKNLIHMVVEYVPAENMDEQMTELLLMGMKEQKMWNEKEIS
ncbi:MAG: DUF3837 domain-containing protein [Lachnospiraceae bacterium]|nr:DUF3837 domain-containing protein [Lachnospiraceae bacterium]